MANAQVLFALSVDQGYQIFVRLVEEQGRTRGVKHQGLLREAMLDPIERLQRGEIDFDPFELAAAYLTALVERQPFAESPDGATNMLVGAMCVVTCLHINDIVLNVTSEEFLAQVARAVKEEITESQFTDFLRASVL